MHAHVHRPEMEKWKQETFPQILRRMIRLYVDNHLPSDGHIDDPTTLNDSVKNYVTYYIEDEVLEYFKDHDYIEPYVEEQFNCMLGIYERTKYPISTRDIPDEYTDLGSLCPELPELIDTVIRELQAERLVKRIETITEDAKGTEC